MKKILVLMSMAVLVLSCKSDPYSDGPKVYGPGKPAEKILPPNFSLDAADEMYFEEGKANTYTIRAIVPAPGNPVITFENMPNGMTYDPATQEIKWTPSLTDGNDPADPTARKRLAAMTVLLQSSSDITSFIRKQVFLVITNVMQKMEFTVSPTPMNQIFEGEAFNANLEFMDQDFPNGPFTIYASDLPAGAELTSDPNSTKIGLSYKPGFRVVTGFEYDKLFTPVVRVVNPNGRTISSTFNLKVKYQTQKPVISGPSRVSQGMSARFSVYAEDLNGENEPDFEVYPNDPADGVFSITTQTIPTTADQNPKVLATIDWKNLPVTYAGKTVKLRLRACARYVCQELPVDVTFNTVTPAPEGGQQ